MSKNIKDEEWQEEESSFSAIKVVLITLLILFLIGVTGLGVGGYYVYTNLQPIDPQSEEFVQVEVPLGSSSSKIAQILEENGLIKNDKIFYLYVRYKGASGFQAGEYYLSKKSTMDELIEQLKDGRVYLESERFTIAEGLSVEQIGAHLAEKGLVNQEQFLKLINEGDFSDIPFVADIPEVKDRKYRLEGFLFPETYEVVKGATEEEIIRTMLKQFDKEIEPEWKEELEKQNRSLYDVITLASIVEREVVVNEERSIIAGVFHNRIREGWKLQSCATVQFVLGKQRDRLLFEDLEVKSPYNTYINPGLPPSPIASPGRASIEATLFPDKHDFFFFVTKKDGTGAHHFSRTFKEHQKNDAQSRGNF